MKIVFVCDTLGSGGAERVISTVSNEFIKKGHDVAVIMLSSTAGNPFYPLDKRIKLIYLTKDFDRKLGFLKKARLLKEAILLEEPDIVISFLSYVCIYTWWALKNTKIPYICSERNDPNQRSWFKQFLLNKAFNKASGCVFQTSDALEWYKKICGDKSTVIYNPVNLEFIPKEVTKRKKQILYVGRLNEQKNCDFLIESFALFSQKHPDYILKMYGDGPLKDRLNEMIQEKNLNEKILILPSSKTWQRDEYDSAVFVLPSKYEGMPNVLAEALCLGIPSVASDCPIGGPKELHKVFPNLLSLFDSFDKGNFVNLMEKALNIQNDIHSVPEVLNTNVIANQWLGFIDIRLRSQK